MSDEIRFSEFPETKEMKKESVIPIVQSGKNMKIAFENFAKWIGISEEKIAQAVEAYLKENSLETGATQEQVAQINENTLSIDRLYKAVSEKEDAGTAESKVSSHNTSTDSHNDIRLLLQNTINTLNAFLDADEETLNQASEMIAYMKDNRGLIEQVTTNKVSVSDIVDNYTTNVSNKPVSAAVAVKLKALIDAIIVPTQLAQLAGDATHRTVTDAEKESWNNKSNFSGSYNDLDDKPDISDYAKKATTLSGYGITDGATKKEVGQLSEQIVDLKSGNVTVSDYWTDELETKANVIQVAIEKAGRNKSSFLWYTDAHWVNGNSKVSPMLLEYLYMNTPMNKVNFGGDIIGDTLLATREEMKYLYEWRKAIKGLPNHHSVFGNHDMFDLASVDYENDNYRYAFLLAPEETSDMIWGDGNYYYIDNASEKTRYLYVAYMTSDHTAMMTQGQFIVDAIKGVPSGWHMVAIAHRWFQYSSSSTPTTGSIPSYESEILSVFDAYNARTTRGGSNYFTAQDFADGKGKVEFCIGGHIHVDYDFFSEGGIPVIITTSDTNQNRVPDSTVDCGTTGTVTESAVFGIIADYNEEVAKITVVGVGRGTSRVVRASSVKPTSISNISYSGDATVESTIDKSKFSFTVNYSDGSTSSVNGASTVTPTTIEVVGDNSVNITYVENGVTLTGTITIAGIAKPVENLLKLDRTYVIGTSGENIANNFDETKAYTNVAYGTGVFNTSSSTASNITENSVTVTESGIGGITVGYPINLPDLSTKSYKLSFDYEGISGKKARVYWRGIYTSGEFAGVNTVCDATGSGHIDADISNTNDYNKIVVFFSSNTGGTCNYTNVSLMEMN